MNQQMNNEKGMTIMMIVVPLFFRSSVVIAPDE